MGNKNIYDLYATLRGYISISSNNFSNDENRVTNFDEEIFKILCNYSISNIDEDNIKKFIEDVCNYLTYYYHVSNYVNNLRIINNKESSWLGDYVSEYKVITINPASISESVKSALSGICNEKIDRKLLLKAKILTVIIHEFEHVLQLKMVENIKLKDISLDEYELLLVYLGFVYFNKDIHKDVYKNRLFPKFFIRGFYNRIYDYIPDERLAFYYSYNKTMQILSKNDTDMDRIILFLNIDLTDKLISGYNLVFNKEVMICPDEKFLKLIGKKDIWKSFEFYDKDREKLLENVINLHDFNHRMKYGFPISIDEYLAFDRKKTDNIKKLTRN